jgi:hypothetical protein
VQFSLGVVFGTVFVEPELLLLRVVVLCDPNAFLQIVALLEAELKGSIIFTTASTGLGTCSVHFGDKAHGSTAWLIGSDIFTVSDLGIVEVSERIVVAAGGENLEGQQECCEYDGECFAVLDHVIISSEVKACDCKLCEKFKMRFWFIYVCSFMYYLQYIRLNNLFQRGFGVGFRSI